jgi:hypothetical protein
VAWSDDRLLAEIYLVVDYLGLIHVLSNLEMKLLMVSCARWSRVSEVERTKIFLNFFETSALKFT